MPSEKLKRVAAGGHQLQRRLAIAIAIAWVAYLFYLLTAKTSPQLGDWAGPPHLTSSIFLALAVSTVLSPLIVSSPLLGWWTIITSTAFIIAFECVQLLTPDRTFEFIDIAEGISGAAIAAMFAASLSYLIGRSLYVWLAIAVGTLVLAASPFLLVLEEQEINVSCDKPVHSNLDWTFVVVKNFQYKNDQLVTNIGPLCQFSQSAIKGDTEGQVATTVTTGTHTDSAGGAAIDKSAEYETLMLNGSGLISAPLPGLRKALSQTGELTFGVRFKAEMLEPGRPPRQVVALQTEQERPMFVARLIQNGASASASFSFRPWQGSSTSMVNRLQRQFHEVVLTYDGEVQTTYFDGLSVGTEITSIDAIQISGEALILNIGRRTDGRWKPFHGEIAAIAIGARSVNATEVATLFTPE